jgi:hypothetical protein
MFINHSSLYPPTPHIALKATHTKMATDITNLPVFITGAGSGTKIRQSLSHISVFHLNLPQPYSELTSIRCFLLIIGIGRATALRFAAAGSKLFLTGRTESVRSPHPLTMRPIPLKVHPLTMNNGFVIAT